MVLAASGRVKAVFMLRSGPRGAGNDAAACVPGGCAWPAAVGHDHGPRVASPVFVAERETEIGARSHAV